MNYRPSSRILIIGRSRPGKANALLNIINHQSDIDKIYLYIEDPFKGIVLSEKLNENIYCTYFMKKKYLSSFM